MVWITTGFSKTSIIIHTTCQMKETNKEMTDQEKEYKKYLLQRAMNDIRVNIEYYLKAECSLIKNPDDDIISRDARNITNDIFMILRNRELI